MSEDLYHKYASFIKGPNRTQTAIRRNVRVLMREIWTRRYGLHPRGQTEVDCLMQMYAKPELFKFEMLIANIHHFVVHFGNEPRTLADYLESVLKPYMAFQRPSLRHVCREPEPFIGQHIGVAASVVFESKISTARRTPTPGKRPRQQRMSFWHDESQKVTIPQTV